MVFKVNISHNGKTLKKEIENEELIGKKIGEIVDGKEIDAELAGYELQITGTGDLSGFAGKRNIEGSGLKRVLLTEGFGLHTKPKGLRKKPVQMPYGFRRKKTVRGNTISKDTIQINTSVKKEGSKKFEEFLPKKEPEKKEVKAENTSEKAEAKEKTAE